jgi:branched-chain amino acid transport system substrate-binding protein
MPGIRKKRCGPPHTFFFASSRASRGTRGAGARGAAWLAAAAGLLAALGCLGGGLPPPLSSEPPSPAGEDLARALYNRGVAATAEGQWEPSYAAFDSVVQLYPGSRYAGVSLRERGIAAYRLGRDSQAAADLQRFLERSPDYETTDTATVLASALQRSRNPEGALTALVRYLSESDADAPGPRSVTEAAVRDLAPGTAARLAQQLPERPFLSPLYRRAADELRATDPDRAAALQRAADRTGGEAGRNRPAVGEPGTKGAAPVVGAILPQSGRLAPVGQEIADGARIALDEVARESGGPPLTLEVVPEEEAATGGAVGRLAEEGVRVVIGPLGSEAALASAAAARDREMLLVSPTATDSTLLRMGPGVVALNATRGDLGQAIGRFAAGDLGLLRVAILASDDDFGHAHARGFRRAFEERGGVVVLERYASTGETNFGEPLRRARLEGAEALFLPTRSADQVLTVISQMEYYSGGRFRLLGTEVWRDPAFLERAGSFAEGAYFVDTFSSDPRATRYADFRTAYFARYSRTLPSNFPAWGYDAAMLALRYLTGPAGGEPEAIYKGAAATYLIAEGAVARVPLISRIEGGRSQLVSMGGSPQAGNENPSGPPPARAQESGQESGDAGRPAPGASPSPSVGGAPTDSSGQGL